MAHRRGGGDRSGLERFGRAAVKRVRRESEKQGAGARRGAGSRGTLLSALGHATRRGSAGLNHAGSGH